MKKELKPTKEDYVHTLTKAVASGIPVIGGSIAEIFFNGIIKPPLERRRNQFINDIANDLEKLQKKVDNFNIKNLTEDEVFITTITHAATIAIKNHQKEKLDALRNVVMNSALGNGPDDDLQMIFLNFVDSFTVLHLKLLKFVDTPKSQEWIENLKQNVYFQEKDGRLSFNLNKTIEYTFPELINRRNLYEPILTDLGRNRLIMDINDKFEILSDGTTYPQIDELGKEFLSFIKEPDL